MDYALKVVQKNGDEDFVCDGLTNIPTRFPSYAAAYHQADFLKIGMEGDVQSINVVKYPKKRKSFAQILHALVDANREFHRRLARNQRRYVVANFSESILLGLLGAVYQRSDAHARNASALSCAP